MGGADFRFFLTAEDPRELPKGSRDPLRFIPVWSGTGRRMIPFLTTVTPSYRGFLTRFLFHGALELYGSPLANRSTDEQWDAFCRFEQLCAVVRTELEPSTPGLPGISRVPGRLNGGFFSVGSQSNHWLGKSQKTTGFWGYYHQACQGVGLLKLNRADRPGYVLTPTANVAFSESSASKLMADLQVHFEPIISQANAQRTFQVDIAPFAQLAEYFAHVPQPGSAIRQFWIDRLLVPESNSQQLESQRAFANRIHDVVRENPTVGSHEIWERLCADDESPNEVTAHARQVRATEAIIGLSEWVFDVCRLRGEEQPNLRSARDWAIRNGYNEDWLDRIKALEEPRSPELQVIRQVALTDDRGVFIPLAKLILERHKSIMRGRGNSPWVSLDEAYNLDIRDPAEDPAGPDLQRYTSGVRWRYDYFLRSWLTAARELGYLPQVGSDA